MYSRACTTLYCLHCLHSVHELPPAHLVVLKSALIITGAQFTRHKKQKHRKAMQGAHLVVMESGAFYQILRRKKNALHLGAFQGGGWYSIFFGFTSSSKRFHWVNLLRKIVDMKISKHLVGGEWFTIHWSTKHMVAAGTMHQRRWLGEWVGSDWGDEVQILWAFKKFDLHGPSWILLASAW